jgi:hypothetical protein
LRTEDNLLELLAAEESPAWVIADEKADRITHVQIVNFAGTQMIEGVFDRHGSRRRDDGRLIVQFLDGRIVNCSVQFDARNPSVDWRDKLGDAKALADKALLLKPVRPPRRANPSAQPATVSIARSRG